jgi:hypothetical protein
MTSFAGKTAFFQVRVVLVYFTVHHHHQHSNLYTKLNAAKVRSPACYQAAASPVIAVAAAASLITTMQDLLLQDLLLPPYTQFCCCTPPCDLANQCSMLGH